MANEVKKTEQNGAKHGKGFWGKKADAKKQSSKTRRENLKKEAMRNQA
ncbi:MAG: hypothetical protein L3J61_02640 [Ghiorsea sp.]|nr:hypothetical protein [Ghiorsea sp.]